MKDNMRIIYHPNMEVKTGNATFASFTHRNFSDNESLPGKKVHMEIVRDNEPMLERMSRSLRQLIRKFWFAKM